MRKTKTFIILTIILSSCSLIFEEIENPFSCEELQPYKVNDTVSYTNQLDTLHFKIKEILLPEWKGYSCEDWMEYKTDQQNNYTISESFYNGEYEDSENHYIDISFYEKPEFETYNFKIKQENKGNYSGRPFGKINNLTVEYLNEYNHNQKNYNHVIIATYDTINFTGKVYKIIRAIPGGILEFHDFKTKQKWKLINMP